MVQMIRVLFLFAFTLMVGCARADYRFEHIDGDKSVALPLKFEGLFGVRDGALVKAQGRFMDGNDTVVMNISLFLRPPAEFQSGTYESAIGGKSNSGIVECPSLDFQGGQMALPTVGGVFVMKDENNRPLYRVRIPSTTLMSLK
jgi:hypothetical protein